MTRPTIPPAEMDSLIAALVVARRHGCPKPGLRLILEHARSFDDRAERIALYGRYCMWYYSPTAIVVDDLMSGRFDGRRYSPVQIERLRDHLPMESQRVRPTMGSGLLPALESLERWLDDRRWLEIQSASWVETDEDLERTVWRVVREIRSFGRYIAIKMCWLLAKGEGWGNDLSTLHARDGGRYITLSFADLAGVGALTPGEVDLLAHDVQQAAADRAGLDVDLLEVESFVCENRQARAGRRYAIRDLDDELEVAERLLPFSDGWYPGWLRLRRDLFPAEALGELNGWRRRRAELMKLQRDAGVVWSDIDFDYGASAPPGFIARR